jgi:hypothetical protein
MEDVEAVEAAESQIDLFISKRAKEKEETNRVEASWAESERRQRVLTWLGGGGTT